MHGSQDKQITVIKLIGFDLAAAFDTVKYGTLPTEFGVTVTLPMSLRSSLEDLTQFVKFDQHQSPVVSLNIDVPQGSCPVSYISPCRPKLCKNTEQQKIRQLQA